MTLDALVRHAAAAGWDQRVVVGTPAEDPSPDVGGLPADQVIPVVFGEGALDFPLPGMSDVMPYTSSRWSELRADQLERYRAEWRRHLARVVEGFAPDLIHSHHLWMMSSLIKDVCPDVPAVAHCHATALRQMVLCPHLAREIRTGVRRCERFVVLFEEQARSLARAFDVAPERVSVVGAGYRDDLFFTAPDLDPEARAGQVAYAGKLAAAKGLPWLLDAVESFSSRSSRRGVGSIRLHVAGGGAGDEAEALKDRMAAMGSTVRYHGRLSQAELADLLRRCSIFVLPSFYEGLPLALIEALACGCRLVCTALPSVEREIAPFLGDAIELVPTPRLEEFDRPVEDDLPAFVAGLEAALEAALDRPPLGDPLRIMPEGLGRFTWAEVFRKVEAIWSNSL